MTEGMRVLKNKTKISISVLVLLAQSLLAMPLFAESVTLNLKGADINAFIGTIADITKKNFIIDPRVKGKVTIISSRAMNEKEVYQVFLSVLEVHGFTAVPIGKIIKILPDADAKHSAIPALKKNATGKGDEAVTRVIEIEHVTAAQLVPILRPLVPPQGHLAAYPASNMLIISDRAANINRLVEIIKRIDQPTSGEIEFIQLEYASAADVVRVLNSMKQNSKNSKAQSTLLVADERTNSILVSGEKARRVQLRAIIAHLDTPTETEGDTHVIYLRYAKAADLVSVLTGVQKSQGKRAAGKKGSPKAAASTRGGSRFAASRSSTFSVQADESTNALVITASPAEFRSLQYVIRKLDIRRAQVLVEAIIAEVSLNTFGKLGVDWIGVNTDSSGVIQPTFGSNFGNGLTQAVAATASGDASQLSLASGLTFGLGKIVDEGFSFVALVNALKTDGSSNILATPNLVTLDNEEAEIFVGQEVSIPSGSFTSSGNDSSNPFTTFNREKVGLTLKVKPQISEGNAIKLEIEQSIEGIVDGSAGEGDLLTSERSLKTTVMVDDGKVLVLGGLIDESVIETESKVPLLGDIPILGVLFRSTSTTKKKDNLMIFLKPIILRTAQKGLKLTQQKYDFIRDQQTLMRDQGVSFVADEELPILPKFEDYLELPPAFESSLQYEERLKGKNNGQADAGVDSGLDSGFDSGLVNKTVSKAPALPASNAVSELFKQKPSPTDIPADSPPPLIE